jgi:hypothetical protein
LPSAASHRAYIAWVVRRRGTGTQIGVAANRPAKPDLAAFCSSAVRALCDLKDIRVIDSPQRP